MKVSRVGFVVVLLSLGFLLLSNNSNQNTSTKAASNLQNKPATPSFLEKGKTYYFRFALTGEGNAPTVITGKVMNLDTETGWVLINHYVLDRSRYRFDGFSWINMNQVYQCSEMAI